MAADDFLEDCSMGSRTWDLWKSAFKPGSEAELVRYAKHLGLGEVITHKSYEDMIDEIAAYKVRQTIPNYDYVGNFAQRIRKSPLGNFIAFPTEIIRTSGNIMWQSYKDARFTGNLRIRGDGAKTRLLDTLDRNIWLKQAILNSNSKSCVNDIDDEELESGQKICRVNGLGTVR